jgi:23S rRNA-intervening sequence protein
MILDHERLDVYRLALDFLVFAQQVIETLPRGRSHLCDQLTRASTSIVLNLAEALASTRRPTNVATTCQRVGRRPSLQRYLTCSHVYNCSTHPGTRQAKRCSCA